MVTETRFFKNQRWLDGSFKLVNESAASNNVFDGWDRYVSDILDFVWGIRVYIDGAEVTGGIPVAVAVVPKKTDCVTAIGVYSATWTAPNEIGMNRHVNVEWWSGYHDLSGTIRWNDVSTNACETEVLKDLLTSLWTVYYCVQVYCYLDAYGVMRNRSRLIINYSNTTSFRTRITNFSYNPVSAVKPYVGDGLTCILCLPFKKRFPHILGLGLGLGFKKV